MITLGRELRGITQARLAGEIGNLTQIELSALETGRSIITDDHIKRISEVLKLPVTFFTKEDPVVKRISKFYYRKRESLSAKDQHMIEAKVKILRSTVLCLLKEVEVEVKDLPRWAVNENSSPEEIANKTRLFFNLDEGPIDNLVSIFEQVGIPVIFLNAASDKFSGMTVQSDVNMPIIFINKNMPNDHKRFTLAHELGHLIMHIPFTDEPEYLSQQRNDDYLEQLERQADRFAGAFLMPANEIKRQMYPTFTYTRLTEFKLYWKVSKQAVIYRARDLGVITQQKFTNLFVELSRNGERRKELLDVAIDEPRLLLEMLHVWEIGLRKTKKEILEDVCGISQSDFEEWLSIPKPLLRVA